MGTVGHAVYICVALEPKYIASHVMTTWNRPPVDLCPIIFLLGARSRQTCSGEPTSLCEAQRSIHESSRDNRSIETSGGKCANSTEEKVLSLSPGISDVLADTTLPVTDEIARDRLTVTKGGIRIRETDPRVPRGKRIVNVTRRKCKVMKSIATKFCNAGIHWDYERNYYAHCNL